MDDTWKLYDKIVGWFDGARCKDLMEREYLELALKVIPEGGKILDLGCGTGEPMAKFFIESGFRVTGVDGSPQMIALCKKRFPEMEWITADMRSINLDKEFDALLAWDSFFHLTENDQRKMFPVFSKHLHKGGVLIFTSGPKAGVEYGRMEGHDFYHASLSLDEYKDLLGKYGFKILLHKVEDPACGQHTVWVTQKIIK